MSRFKLCHCRCCHHHPGRRQDWCHQNQNDPLLLILSIFHNTSSFFKYINILNFAVSKFFSKKKKIIYSSPIPVRTSTFIFFIFFFSVFSLLPKSSDYSIHSFVHSFILNDPSFLHFFSFIFCIVYFWFWNYDLKTGTIKHKKYWLLYVILANLKIFHSYPKHSMVIFTDMFPEICK